MFETVTSTTLIIFVILLLLGVIFATIFALLVYSGLFTSLDDVSTGKPPIGQVILAYKFVKGPYSGAGQTFTEAAVIAPENKALGIYYDDPTKVEQNNLRYVVGSILSEGSKPLEEEMVKRFTSEGFKIVHLPEVTFAVKTRFPHVTTMSILIGVRKAYSSLKSYIEEHKLCAHPCIEYYDGNHIHFMVPLSKQSEFYVPECDEQREVHEEFDTTAASNSQSEDSQSQVTANTTHTFSENGDDMMSSKLEHDDGSTDRLEKKDEGNEIDITYKAALKEEKEWDDAEGGQASDDSSSSFEVLKTE